MNSLQELHNLAAIVRKSRRWKTSLIWLAVFLLCQLVANPAEAWWGDGHIHIAIGAVDHLPRPLRDFFEIHKYEISSLAADEPQGRHYIDIDVYEEFHAGNFPRDVNVLIAKYGYDFVEGIGMGPWTYENYVNELTSLMAAAKSSEDWLGITLTSAEQAHYIEDLHNPLHLTENYNGQLSGNNGIHARYEGEMIMRHLDDLPFIPVTATYLPSVIDNTLDDIEIHYEFMDDIIAADNFAESVSGGSTTSIPYYNALWNQTYSFTQQLFQEASEAVADGWYTAWINAGAPIPNLGLDGDYNGNNEVDAADYTVWRDAMAASSNQLINDSTPGIVNSADFSYWRSHFGATMGGGSGSTSLSTPEPTSAAIAALLMAACCTAYRFRPCMPASGTNCKFAHHLISEVARS